MRQVQSFRLDFYYTRVSKKFCNSLTSLETVCVGYPIQIWGRIKVIFNNPLRLYIMSHLLADESNFLFLKFLSISCQTAGYMQQYKHAADPPPSPSAIPSIFTTAVPW